MINDDGQWWIVGYYSRGYDDQDQWYLHGKYTDNE